MSETLPPQSELFLSSIGKLQQQVREFEKDLTELLAQAEEDQGKTGRKGKLVVSVPLIELLAAVNRNNPELVPLTLRWSLPNPKTALSFKNLVQLVSERDSVVLGVQYVEEKPIQNYTVLSPEQLSQIQKETIAAEPAWVSLFNEKITQQIQSQGWQSLVVSEQAWHTIETNTFEGTADREVLSPLYIPLRSRNMFLVNRWFTIGRLEKYINKPVLLDLVKKLEDT